jgi:large subunit ribosomal protein L10
MARPEKEAAVAELAAKLRDCGSIIVTDYRGLRVKALGELRRQLRAAGAQYQVVKNTMMRRAADEVGMGELAATLEGPTAVMFAAEDASAAAKALLAFARGRDGLPQVRGVMQGARLYPPAAAQDLATLPGREGLLAMVMGAFEAPVGNLITALQSPVAVLVATLDEIVKQQESGAAEVAA